MQRMPSSHRSSRILTLLCSQKDLPKNWQEDCLRRVSPPTQVHLFLLDQATHLLGEDFSWLPSGKRVFCAHSHRLIQALPPPENTTFEAGGLANLGEMVRHSHMVISFPNCHGPTQRGKPGIKNIGVVLGQAWDTQKEAIRLAAGLAGCNHKVTLYTPITKAELRVRFPETTPLLEALEFMKVVFKTVPAEASMVDHPVVLQL